MSNSWSLKEGRWKAFHYHFRESHLHMQSDPIYVGKEYSKQFVLYSCRRQTDAGHRLPAQDPAVPSGHRRQKCGGGTAALRLPGGAPRLQPVGQGHRFVPPGFRVQEEPSFERLALARTSRLGITCKGICLQHLPHVHLALILASKHSDPNRAPHRRFQLDTFHADCFHTKILHTFITPTPLHTVPRHDHQGL